MRHYEFLDPNDRSPSSPIDIAKKTRILALWNQNHPDEKMQNVTEKVKEWFVDESKKLGWSEATFAGNECILKKNF